MSKLRYCTLLGLWMSSNNQIFPLQIYEHHLKQKWFSVAQVIFQSNRLYHWVKWNEKNDWPFAATQDGQKFVAEPAWFRHWVCKYQYFAFLNATLLQHFSRNRKTSGFENFFLYDHNLWSINNISLSLNCYIRVRPMPGSRLRMVS